MASQNDFGFKSLQASGAISAYIIVALQADGTITAAGLEAKGIGVTQEDVPDAAYCNVKLWSAPGTFKVQVTGTAVTAASTYTTVTGGRVGTTITTARVVCYSNAVASNGIVTEFQAL